MVLYKLYIFCSDMKFKMVATAGLSLTLDPMGKMFQNASSLRIFDHLPVSIGSLMLLHLNFVIMFLSCGNNFNKYFSKLKKLSYLYLNCKMFCNYILRLYYFRLVISVNM
jgi:hypothetical protein